ncbi:MAG TPA: hypothetical protein VLB44_08780 [Kofleriaceae bacterium]|nr:hypothetical protein [Kofleriaceae bacterium]
MRALIIILVSLIALSRLAHADPSNERLFFTGLAMAPPTYLIGVTLHEGSHALAAEIVGGDVDELHLFPPGVDPKVHKFRFGWTYVHGLKTRGQRIFFFLAPKITDSLLLAGYTALLFTAWPSNKYGQLALTVGATGLWVDFSKDLVLFSPHNDVTKGLHGWCMYGWKQLPARLVYAAAVGGFGYLVARGYQKTFTEQPVMMPIASVTF